MMKSAVDYYRSAVASDDGQPPSIQADYRDASSAGNSRVRYRAVASVEDLAASAVASPTSGSESKRAAADLTNDASCAFAVVVHSLMDLSGATANGATGSPMNFYGDYCDRLNYLYASRMMRSNRFDYYYDDS